MSFTWFDKFTEALSKLSPEDRKEVVWAMAEYGMTGEMPEIAYPLNVIAESFREDIDNSAASRANGARGGRPSSKPGVSGDAKPGVSDEGKPGVSGDAKPGVSENREISETPSYIDQTKPDQSKPDQTSGEVGKRKRFSPPPPAEVDAYMRQRGTPIDAERFCDFYASKGWKVGKSPMRDWMAAARNWAKRDGEERDGPHAADPANPDGGWLR